MKSNFEAAVANAIKAVATLLDRPSWEIATEALKDGSVREMVISLAIAQA